MASHAAWAVFLLRSELSISVGTERRMAAIAWWSSQYSTASSSSGSIAYQMP